MFALLSVQWSSCGSPGPGACVPPGTQIEEPRAAGCVVVDRERLLLVQSTYTLRWSLPGGRIDPGERAPDAAVRETWEEARVRVRADAPLCGVAANDFVAYRCTLAPTADDETRDARFMTRDEIAALTPEQLRFPDQKADYLRFLGD